MNIAYASIVGSTHRALEYNNQDFVLVKSIADIQICLVADGCGSGSNSEVGAQLALNFIAKTIVENNNWQKNLMERLNDYSQNLAEMHSDDSQTFIKNFLLYTIVGCVVRDEKIILFSCGDGVILINENLNVIDQDNRPRYLNNSLISNTSAQIEFQQVDLNTHSILIGTDGVEDLINGIESEKVNEYSSLTELINDEFILSNPVRLPKLLQKYSRKGILKDDCSLVIIKLK